MQKSIESTSAGGNNQQEASAIIALAQAVLDTPETSSSHDDVVDELGDRIAEAIDSRTGPEINELILSMQQSIFEKENAYELTSLIDAFVSAECAMINLGDDNLVHTLMALPIIVSTNKAAWELEVSAAQAARITSALKKHGQINAKSSVRFLPKVLSMDLAKHLSHGAVCTIARGLAIDAPEMYEDLLTVAAEATDASQAPNQDLVSSFGVLVAIVSTSYLEDPFPVRDAEKDLPVSEEFHDDLKVVLGATAVQCPVPVGLWGPAVELASHFSRGLNAAAMLQAAALANGFDSSDQLAVDAQVMVDPNMHQLIVPILVASTKQVIGDLTWPACGNELPEETIEHFCQFCAANGIQILSDKSKAQLAAKNIMQGRLH